MKYLRISALATFTLIIFNLSGQISNLEILDHSEHRTILTTFLENKGDVLYVIENDRRGYSTSQVKLARNNEIPINILSEDLDYRTKSKWFYTSNNELRIYLYGLANAGFDDFSTDIIQISEENGNYESKRISNPFMISLEGVTSVALDSLNQLYAITNYPRIQMFESEELVNEVFREISHNSILHNNSHGEVYLIDSGLDTIFKVNELQIEFVSTLEKEIKEVKSVNNSIWALTTDDKIFQYNSDFIGTTVEIILPFAISSLNQVSTFNSNVFLMEHLPQGFKIYNYNTGNTTLISEFSEDHASSLGIYVVSDSTFLTSGQFEIEEIANHAFVRGYNLNQPYEPVRRNISLSDFDLYYQKDTIISGAPNALWLYGVNYNIENLGNITSELNSVYTSHLVPQFTSGHFLFEQHLNEPILENQIQNIDTSRLIAYYHPTIATASITGSDYKFNQSFSPIDIGITTSIEELKTNQFTKIYPNPFNSNINIDSELKQKISIYSSNGILLIRTNTDQVESQNLGWLPIGTYYLKLEESGEIITVVKMNDER